MKKQVFGFIVCITKVCCRLYGMHFCGGPAKPNPASLANQHCFGGTRLSFALEQYSCFHGGDKSIKIALARPVGVALCPAHSYTL